MSRNNKSSFITLSFLLFFGVSQIAFAGEFVSLSGLPGIEPSGSGGLGDTFNTLYVISVVAGSLFAVIKIAIAGTKYMVSDVVTSKESAKNDIRGAILGLVIILATYVVLSTIYPGLVDFDILELAYRTHELLLSSLTHSFYSL